jgi:hypothetical protein
MKNFRIQIRYYGYYADFNVQCKDTAIDIENSILDKLGKNEVKFESDGFTSKKGKWITYEEVTNDRRPIHYERSLELEWQQEHLKEGRYTLHMGHIDKKIQEVVKEIIAKEFDEQTLQTKIAKPSPKFR